MLDKLIQSQKDNNARLASIEKSINSLVAINKRDSMREATEARRLRQAERRQKTYRGPGAAVKEAAKATQEASKGLLSGIMGLLKNPLVLAGLGALLMKAVFDIFSNKKTQKAVGEFFQNAWDSIYPAIRDNLVKAWNFLVPKIKQGLTDAWNFLIPKLKAGAEEAFAWLKPKFEEAAHAAGNILKDIIYNAFNGLKSWGLRQATGQRGDPRGFAEAVASATEREAEALREAKKLKKEKHDEEKKYFNIIRVLEERRDQGADERELKRIKSKADAQKKEVQIKIDAMKKYEQLEKDKGIYEEQNYRIRRAREMNFGLQDYAFAWGTGANPAAQVQNWKSDSYYLHERGYQKGGSIKVPGSGSGDKVRALVSPGSFVMNREASKIMGFQTGGAVPVALEPGEQVYGPGSWGPMHAMMNTIIPRFQEGGEVHDYLKKMNDKNINKATAPPGYCVVGSLKTMESSGVPNPQATGRDVGNNPRGAIVQLTQMGWGSMPGGSGVTLKSPYGTAGVNVMSAGEYQAKVKGGGVPSGALIFQTSHDSWNGTSNRSRGYDFAIAQKNGGQLWNGQSMPMMVYGGSTKKVIALTPGGAGFSGGKPGSGGGSPESPQTPGQGSTAGFIEAIGGAAGNAGSAVNNPVTQGIGGMMDAVGGAGLKAISDAGLPGLADQMYMMSEGFKQSKAAQALGAVIGGVTNMFGGLFGSLSGALGDKDDKGGGGWFSGLSGGSADTSTGAGPGSLSGPVTPVSVSDPNAKALLEAISTAEGTPSYGTMFGGATNAQLAGGQLTVNQALAAANRNPGSGATGKYQFMPQTFKDLMRAGVWKGDQKLTPALQDKGAMWLIQNKRGVNLSDGLSQKEVQELSWEWASIKGNNYTYGGKAQGRIGQGEFMDWYKTGGGKIQGHQTGGVVNMRGGSTPNMARYKQAMEMFSQSMAGNSAPIIVPVPMPQSGGGGSKQLTGGVGTPNAPNLPSGPSVVALLELQNRLALGAAL